MARSPKKLSARDRVRQAYLQAVAESLEEPPIQAGLHYAEAPEVAEIARELISQHHSHLVNTRIEYVFRSKAATNRGRIVLGKAKKVSGLSAFLTTRDPDAFFVMEIAQDRWTELTSEQRVALVDHELTHMGVDPDTGKLQLYPHDLEEFVDIVRRHGLWSAEVMRFARATSQLELPFDVHLEADGTRVEEVEN